MADARYLEANKPMQVKITAVVNYSSDADVPKVILQRLNFDGTWRTLGLLGDDGRNGDSVAKDKIFTLVVRFSEKEPARIRLRVSAEFALEQQTLVEELSIPVGVVVAPRAGATVKGSRGTSVTVSPNAIQYEALIGIAPAPSSALSAPVGKLGLVSALDIIFIPTFFKADVGPPQSPLQIALLMASKTRASRFIIAQQVLSDSISETKLGLRQQLVPVSAAVLAKGNIVSQKGVFSGIVTDGLFALLEATGSGYVTGIVSEQGVPRPGVVVSNSTNTLVSITDATGRYSLFISGGPFTVTAFHPLRASSGSASGNIAVNQSTVTADIPLTSLSAPPVTRDGIRNGGFERCDLSSWTPTGSVNAIQSLGPTSNGVTISPTEGRCMVDLVTGSGSIGSVGSSLKQSLIVPAGVSHLRFDVNFVSEEFPEWVGSKYDDTFRALITTPNGQTVAYQISVNQSGGFQLIGDCFFPGGDATCGQTGWREASIDLSSFAQVNNPITVELLFTVTDAGDNIYDTHVLIDNIRFRTLWLDAKLISGATADVTRVQTEVLAATEILSQAGLNVRLRPNSQTLNQSALLDVDVTWSTTGSACPNPQQQRGHLTAEENLLITQARSATNTDVNVYYARSVTGPNVGGKGFSINPDDFCHEVTLLGNSGTIQTDSGAAQFLAHELGHLLISPDNSGSSNEHGSGSGNFMLPDSPTLGMLTRQQSQEINASGVLGP